MRNFFVRSGIFLAILFCGNIVSVQAGQLQNVRGWLWGGGVTANPPGYQGTGWWSMNDLNCDTDGNGFVDVACGGNNTTTAIVPYGVSIPQMDGTLSGYAWSEYYGWLSFNGADTVGCPTGSCAAVRTGNAVSGWARILPIKTEASKPAPNNAGGWSGWVKLASEAGASVSYGVMINPDNTLGGSAWSDELGWIDFSRATILPLAAACGPAAHTYPSNAPGLSGAYCGAGSTIKPVGSTPTLPADATPVSWTCEGAAHDTTNCTANRVCSTNCPTEAANHCGPFTTTNSCGITENCTGTKTNGCNLNWTEVAP